MRTTERSVVTTSSDFVLVYPHGFDLPFVSAAALASAGIAHRAAGFPYEPEHDEGEHVVYLIDIDRLRTLSKRPAIEQALMLIQLAQEATTVIIAPPSDPDAEWLSANENVGGWLTWPIDPHALLATVRGAAAVLHLKAEANSLRQRASATERE